MKDQHYKTTIIGGGISGLACARRLHDAGQDFLLITEELGGRMKCDEKTGIHLGAGLVLSNYENVLKYVGTLSLPGNISTLFAVDDKSLVVLLFFPGRLLPKKLAANAIRIRADPLGQVPRLLRSQFAAEFAFYLFWPRYGPNFLVHDRPPVATEG